MKLPFLYSLPTFLMTIPYAKLLWLYYVLISFICRDCELGALLFVYIIYFYWFQ